MKPYRRDLKPLARKLRGNMTDAENLLWQRLREKQLFGLQFYRQKPMLDFIVDFYCPGVRLVIELDGSQHREMTNAANDNERDARLAAIGVTVLRFDNLQVLQETEAVLMEIYRVMKSIRGPLEK